MAPHGDGTKGNFNNNGEKKSTSAMVSSVYQFSCVDEDFLLPDASTREYSTCVNEDEDDECMVIAMQIHY